MNIKKICAAISAAMLLSSAAMAADKSDVPSEVNADAIDYDMNTGVVSAEGNVLLKHGTARATGLHALFNVNTKEAHLIGNVIATQTVAPDTKYPNGDTRTFTGEHIDYYPDDKKHVVIPNGGLAESKVEGTFTADHLEGWLDDEHYVGTGNAHLVSPVRQLEAGGDKVDYSGKDDGRAVLSGNAWAYQDNNTIRGNRLTVYLADDGTLKAKPAPKVTMPTFDEAVIANRNIAADKPADSTVTVDPAQNHDEAKKNES